MAPREMDSGTSFALEAIQGSIEGYKASVEQGFRDLRSDLKDHVRDEERWQERMETEILKLVGLPGQVESIKTKVEQHEGFFQQAKGAAIASKLLWALLGVAAAGVTWLMTNVLVTAPRTGTPAPAFATAYVVDTSNPAPKQHSPAASGAASVDASVK